ncbi:hypothetical protein VTN77DRAFT_9262 [Rasamsonia byssochlamydoides]|uniref:uncharacterized protein n=1 Tax=Rasamsonia byssochlamydoides TaxID=89139 RepID=UPI0037444DE2
MPSGLQNPSAIPLLTLVVATLLTITPIVCDAWRTYSGCFHPARPSWVDNGLGRDISRDSSTSYTSRFEVGDALPLPEKTGIYDPAGDQWTSIAGDAWTGSVKAVNVRHAQPVSPLENPGQSFVPGIQLCSQDTSDLNSTSTTSLPRSSICANPADQSHAHVGVLRPLSVRLWETWQQVCQTSLFRLASVDGGLLKRPISRSVLPDHRVALSNPPAGSHSTPRSPHTPITHSFNFSPPSFERIAEETKVGGGASSPADRRGSFLAILVSLVVGILWF